MPKLDIVNPNGTFNEGTERYYVGLWEKVDKSSKEVNADVTRAVNYGIEQAARDKLFYRRIMEAMNTCKEICSENVLLPSEIADLNRVFGTICEDRKAQKTRMDDLEEVMKQIDRRVFHLDEQPKQRTSIFSTIIGVLTNAIKSLLNFIHDKLYGKNPDIITSDSTPSVENKDSSAQPPTGKSNNVLNRVFKLFTPHATSESKEPTATPENQNSSRDRNDQNLKS